MKISWNWLQDYIKSSLSIDESSAILTSIGLEVESIQTVESIRGGMVKYVIGKVLTCVKHPNADKLSLTEVDLGEMGIHKIVCGAPNVASGQTVVVATEGATIYLPSGESFVIKHSKIRGEESQGMICAEDELGIGESHDGILILSDDVAPGTAAATYFKLESDYLIEIGLTPNRTDAMSHKGVARDLSAALTAQDIPHTFFEDGSTPWNNVITDTNESLVVQSHSDQVPIIGAVTISNITNAESPQWLQNRLKTIGEKPRNIIIDVTNYILHDLGQPLHAYDLSTVQSYTIDAVSNMHPEILTALNGLEIKLEPNDIVIRDSSQIIALGGVIGGKNTEIKDSTEAIILEAAYFDPTQIRITSQRIGLKTEASMKFEKGVDPNGVAYALSKARQILSTLSPQATSSEVKWAQNHHFSPWKVTLRYSKLTQYAGVAISIEKVNQILNALGIQIVGYDAETWQLEVPRFKADVTREEDIVEEILRIYGYNQIPYPVHLRSNIIFQPTISMTDLEVKISNLLVGNGYNEIMTNSISQSRYYAGLSYVPLLNSMTSELDCMRPALIPSVLEVMEYNSRRDIRDMRLFEIGNEYYPQDKNNYTQQKKLILAITGFYQAPNWEVAKGVTNDFFQLKSTIHSLLTTLQIQTSIVETTNVNYHYGLDIMLSDGKKLGTMGECKIDSNLFDIKQSVLIAELDAEIILHQVRNKKSTFKEWSKFPNVKRDLALLIPMEIEFSQIEAVCKKSLKTNLVSISLFDVFRDASLGENKKSYAIRLILQNEEKTMSDKEIDSLIQKVIVSLEKEVSATIRS